MALTAKLFFGDTDKTYSLNSEDEGYLVIDYHFHIMRHHEFSYPDANPCCESIELIVETPGATDLTLYDWYINGTPLSGCIMFEMPSSENDQTPKPGQLLFEDAYCFSQGEIYKADTREKRILKLSIFAKKVTINDIIFSTVSQ